VANISARPVTDGLRQHVDRMFNPSNSRILVWRKDQAGKPTAIVLTSQGSLFMYPNGRYRFSQQQRVDKLPRGMKVPRRTLPTRVK